MPSPENPSTRLHVRRPLAKSNSGWGHLREMPSRDQHWEPWKSLRQRASAQQQGEPVTLSDDDLIEALLGALTDSERDGAVIYLAIEPVEAGEVVNVPGIKIHFPGMEHLRSSTGNRWRTGATALATCCSQARPARSSRSRPGYRLLDPPLTGGGGWHGSRSLSLTGCSRTSASAPVNPTVIRTT